MDDSDDIPQLPSDTLLLLEQFNADQEARTKRFEDLKNEAENQFQLGKENLTMDLFHEDWNASQFWYTDTTADMLAQQLLDGAQKDTVIGLISAPSVYVAIRRTMATWGPERPHPKLKLFEYDERFRIFGDEFVYYDFRQPQRIPLDLIGRFDRLLCDPPFLSEDCQTKTAVTARTLARSWRSPSSSDEDGLRLIICTGERMEMIILRLYDRIGIQTTTFDPEHRKGLSNEFRCFANFQSNAWSWR